MISDPDIYRAAKLVMEQQGEEAANFAAGCYSHWTGSSGPRSQLRSVNGTSVVYHSPNAGSAAEAVSQHSSQATQVAPRAVVAIGCDAAMDVRARS